MGVERSAHFIQLDRQSVRICKESEPFTGEFINADGFDRDPISFQIGNLFLEVIHQKGDMSESPRLGAVDSYGRIGEGEKLNLRSSRNSQIEFVGISFGTVSLSDYPKGQHFGIECLGADIIRAND